MVGKKTGKALLKEEGKSMAKMEFQQELLTQAGTQGSSEPITD